MIGFSRAINSSVKPALDAVETISETGKGSFGPLKGLLDCSGRKPHHRIIRQ